jgi:hypothetical protein
MVDWVPEDFVATSKWPWVLVQKCRRPDVQMLQSLPQMKGD